MSEAEVEVRGLARSFGAFRAVAGVDFQVSRGSVHAIIGPNGAGKSTLFKLITGVLRPSAGEVYLRGTAIGGRRAHSVARRGLVQVFQMTSVFPRLTVLEAVSVGIIAQRHRERDLLSRFNRRAALDAAAVLDRVGLGPLGDRLAGELSHGDQRALELAMALATDPQVLLLDEPTAGMSPAETAATARLIADAARERGLTVVLSEHDMDVIFGISDHITVLHQGRVIADGEPEQIRRDPQVMAIYLGGHGGDVVVGDAGGGATRSGGGPGYSAGHPHSSTVHP